MTFIYLFFLVKLKFQYSSFIDLADYILLEEYCWKYIKLKMLLLSYKTI